MATTRDHGFRTSASASNSATSCKHFKAELHHQTNSHMLLRDMVAPGLAVPSGPCPEQAAPAALADPRPPPCPAQFSGCGRCSTSNPQDRDDELRFRQNERSSLYCGQGGREFGGWAKTEDRAARRHAVPSTT
uniref:Uncharacterized protein n=1 Tax=Macrostomum lignano TaxID=282301 RepID=A0A1I8FJ27_9PLAT